ncbi:hypothetical protein Htur_0951 [Haloterrigena turkmenica DSM 5511]|uniref:Flagellin n=1 Tax=Haloterrigena turkmenica (strain ATCC 51198 / DSM 5511 / JCM 9101 / NCIMB 13204 / VKM B-1734 / 4k) TaxID=543526 RepID=D2RYE4_HALTV|nr:hypothetical protein [Haloterrigena turkmenica]ADB59845.1 hypothetical protein Htur_0951 [Haloterrigena turkmenica DSM 5511]
MIRRSDYETDRGMSIALTHVLTIGITTILIAMLLMAGSTMLESETERSTETALETVGERLAGDIDNVDRMADDSDDVSLVSDRPRTVSNSGYTVTTLSADDCGDRAPLLNDSNPCLELDASSTDVTVHVPIKVDNGIETGTSVSGGSLEITYTGGDIEITEADR